MRLPSSFFAAVVDLPAVLRVAFQPTVGQELVELLRGLGGHPRHYASQVGEGLDLVRLAAGGEAEGGRKRAKNGTGTLLTADPG